MFYIRTQVFFVINCNLATLLAKKKWKVADAVRGTGISQSTLLKLYHEKTKGIDFDTIDKLCVFFDCEVGELLTRSPTPIE